MLYAQMMGGLGNQMFIYAFARAFQLRHGGEVTFVVLCKIITLILFKRLQTRVPMNKAKQQSMIFLIAICTQVTILKLFITKKQFCQNGDFADVQRKSLNFKNGLKRDIFRQLMQQ